MVEELVHFLDNLDQFVEPVAGDENRRIYWVQISPQAKQSVRFGKFGAFVSPKKQEYVKALSDNFTAVGEIWNCPVRVSVLFAFGHLSTFDYSKDWTLHVVRPDLDNCIKPCLDSLVKILEDDARVVELKAVKIRFPIPVIVVIVDKVIEKSISICKQKDS